MVKNEDRTACPVSKDYGKKAPDLDGERKWTGVPL
jgi:hypothetical protein